MRLRKSLTVLAVVTVVCAWAAASIAQPNDGISYSGTKLIAPFFSGAFPSGRFGETDVNADPPKSGHNAGWAGGLDIGFFANDYFAVGISAGYVRFPIDFGPEIEAQFPTNKANTSVLLGEVWARAFLPGGFNRWRPYALVGLGMGRPKGTIDYKNPFIIPLPDNSGQIDLQSAESTVNTTVAITGGVGFLIPASPSLAIAVEPRYTSISTKGSGRTDKYTDTSGETYTLDDKAKSNTTWWEIRGGIVIAIH